MPGPGESAGILFLLIWSSPVLTRAYMFFRSNCFKGEGSYFLAGVGGSLVALAASIFGSDHLICNGCFV